MAAIAGDGLDSEVMEVRSNGGAFSLADLDFRDERGLAELGLGDDAGSVEFASLKIAFLGSMKCFIASTDLTERKRTFLERERENVCGNERE